MIDTADVCGPYTNGELVGRAPAGGCPEHVHRSIDASLRRLGTDNVDPYQPHRVDPQAVHPVTSVQPEFPLWTGRRHLDRVALQLLGQLGGRWLALGVRTPPRCPPSLEGAAGARWGGTSKLSLPS
ncbi:aldo/keto reductase [Nonomuraea turkmeniaca]|uniref:aldo/keto reductase n=1 Tax=Nonomuraea turkmeniaca TaxID=103838 RepID=UPI001FEBF1A9|nr:aldo/keto reductase [Nonomuraea turkmeniaca]